MKGRISINDLLEMPFYRFQAIYHYISIKSEKDADNQDSEMKKLEKIIEDEMS